MSIHDKILWLLGPTSAGKSTIASALEEQLRKTYDFPAVHWDGDHIRNMFGPKFDFSAKNRLKVVQTLAALAQVSSSAGIITIVSALTAHDDARQFIQATLPNLILCYVHCSIDQCIERDPKGLYRRAAAGEIKTVIGYNSVYNPPAHPRVNLDTSRQSVPECVDILAKLAIHP
ncbi:MAG: hypothetical protein CBB68_08900 [Rhodospirillaceae bacterium TMED8]|nr:adenylyl-sulfate kinase [Magnetovibrio sp.]OUT50478.1 MAG: hypothetical protein CBB68_08900 [Rhodospirillaceae bacterium TMED8]|tara:strand:- start:624 stop:1145 length:522 start_codon:yes stop_codon:yes gene_type:complete